MDFCRGEGVWRFALAAGDGRRVKALLAVAAALGAWLLCASPASASCPSATGDAYSTAVLADSPIAFYRLDEPAGNTMCDSSASVNDGTYNSTGITYGVPGPLITSPLTAVQAASSPVGTSNGNAALTGNSSFTYEAWFRSTGTRQNQALVDVGQAGAGEVAGLTTWSNASCNESADESVSMLGLDEHGTSNCWNTLPGVNLYDGQWHYLAVAYDAASGTVTGYVDGASLGSQTLQTAGGSFNLGASPIRVGSWVDTNVNKNLTGDIADVAVYPTSLSGARIAAHYAAASASAPPGSPTTATFTTQGCSLFALPAAVFRVQISAVAAAGSSGQGVPNAEGGAGGSGDGVAATASVSPGQKLTVCVGFGGGGDGGGDGGAGGGLSGVAGGSSFSSPWVLAGGGGGGGGGGEFVSGASGGGAGAGGSGAAGSGGGGGTADGVGSGGTGGTSGGGCTTDGADGSPGSGNSGGAGGAGGCGAGGGGGGGGGYHGGGGGGGGPGFPGSSGGGGGGGGGADFCADAAPVSGCKVSAGAGTETATGAAAGDAHVILTYTVAAAPSASISAPTGGATYTQGQLVDSSFTCTDGSGGTGIASCVDQNGRPSGAPIDTSTAGSHTFAVTATSSDGLTATKSVTYKVVSPGATITKAKISSKHHQATFSFKAAASAGFQCALIKQPKHKLKHKKPRKPKPHFSSCSSPKTYKHLAAGKYTFEVRAVLMGVTGQATSHSFKIT